MPSGTVILVAAAVGALWWGGAKIGHGVKVGAIKTGCAIEKVVTVGHKHCQKKTGK